MYNFRQYPRHFWYCYGKKPNLLNCSVYGPHLVRSVKLNSLFSFQGGGWLWGSWSAVNQQEVFALIDLPATGSAHVPRRWANHQRCPSGGAERPLSFGPWSPTKPMWIWVPLPQRVTQEPTVPCGGEWKIEFFYLLKISLSSLIHDPRTGRADCLIFVLPQMYHEESHDNKAGNAAGGRGEEWVRLTRLYQFARNVRALLHTYHYNQIFLTDFQGAYNKFTGYCLEPRSYGYMNTDELLSAIPQVNFIWHFF